jgi:hypothetical protein
MSAIDKFERSMNMLKTFYAKDSEYAAIPLSTKYKGMATPDDLKKKKEIVTIMKKVIIKN